MKLVQFRAALSELNWRSSTEQIGLEWEDFRLDETVPMKINRCLQIIGTRSNLKHSYLSQVQKQKTSKWANPRVRVPIVLKPIRLFIFTNLDETWSNLFFFSFFFFFFFLPPSVPNQIERNSWKRTKPDSSLGIFATQVEIKTAEPVSLELEYYDIPYRMHSQKI